MQSAMNSINPAENSELVSIGELLPYANNARTHSDEQVSQVAASIREFGFTIPVLIDENKTIIAGHCRVSAARKLDIQHIPCIKADGWTEHQKRAYVIVDNQLTLNASWNDDMLSIELQKLNEAEFDLSLIGFNQDELANFLNTNEGLTDPDDVPETPDNPVSQTGDLWILGNHRLVCGDSTKSENVLKLLDAVIPHLMVTDPPYGVEYDASWRIEYGWSREISRGKVSNDDKVDWRAAWELFNGVVAYIWHASLAMGDLIDDLDKCGLVPRSQIVWAKQDCDVIINRWQNFTGEQAKHENGKTFSERQQLIS